MVAIDFDCAEVCEAVAPSIKHKASSQARYYCNQVAVGRNSELKVYVEIY